MTFPEDLQSRPEQSPVKPPNYALGFLLNFFLPGAGFSYINRWGWHLGWLAIVFGVQIISLVLAAALGPATARSTFLLPLLAWIAMLVHYHFTYQQGAARGFQPPLNDGVKVAFIVGQLVIGFFVTGLLAAVLLPNLLGARMRATKAAENAIARNIYTQVLADQAEDKPLSTTCPTVPPVGQTRVTHCQVDISNPDDLKLEVTFESGHTVELP